MPQFQIDSLCPSPHTISEYATGSLSENDAERLLAHLNQCGSCQQQFDERVAQEDSILFSLRRGYSQAPLDDESGLHDWINQACSDETHTDSADVSDVSIDHDIIALDDFVAVLEKSRLVHGSEIELLLDTIKPDDTDSFAHQLVQRKRLTKFQAQALKRGHYKGLVLGNYVVLEKLGEGGMGQVFKARHRRMGRVVCLKVLHAAGRDSPEMVKRFKRETRAVAALNHPNIVVAHDAGEDDGVAFLVMEHIDGTDLARYVKQNGPMAPSKAVSLLLPVADALGYAHDQGLVHRDIKPHNLLLDKAGSVKILDMGLARFDAYLNQDADASTHAAMTNSGVVMGTVDYMSPEQALNCRNANAQSDVYSFGCTLYFLLTGKSVFDGQTTMERLVAHREHQRPSLMNTVAEASSDLDAVFGKMLAKDPENRYQCMSELVADLTLLQQGRRPHAVSRRDGVVPSRTKRRLLPLTLVAVFAALIVGAFFISLFRDRLNVALTGERANVPPIAAASATVASSATGATADNTNRQTEEAIQARPAASAIRSQALVIVPQKHFDAEQYESLTSALKSQGVGVETASSRAGVAHSTSDRGKITPIFVSNSLDQFNSKDYDAIFFIDGNRNEFMSDENNGCLSETKILVREAINRGGMVATLGDACQVVLATELCINCSSERNDGVEILSPTDGRPGKFLRIERHDQANSLVQLIFDENGIARQSKRQVDSD